MAKLTVSIVNFNGGEFLINCLKSLEKSKQIEMEIFVVDNNSSDDSLVKAQQNFPKINFIKNSDNLGFGKAHNLVLKNLKTEFVLILNPDTEVKSGVIPTLINYLEQNPQVGAISPKIILGNGQLDPASHRGFPTPWAAFLYYFLKDDSLYHLTKRPMDSPHEVDAISGSFFLTRKNVLEKVGLFDEDYFMYAEDLDLCFRIKQAGFKVVFYPGVSVTHYKGVTSGIKKHSSEISTATNESRLKAFNSFYETMIIFYKKNLSKKYPFFINWLVYLGINLKWALAKRNLQV